MKIKDKETASTVEYEADHQAEQEPLPSASPDDQDSPRPNHVHEEGAPHPHEPDRFIPDGEYSTGELSPRWKEALLTRLAQVNKELWLLLSIMLIAGSINYAVTSQHVILGLYALPTLFSAYCFGRRHAILTAIGSVLLVGFLAQSNAAVFGRNSSSAPANSGWYEVAAWGGILIVTAYAMGTLYERHKARLKELHHTYRGLLLILRQFIARDKYTENHCYRVSIYATKIATTMGIKPQQIEDIRVASLIHDIGKLDTSRELLYKAARLTEEEFNEVKKHVDRGASLLKPVAGPLHRVIPILIAHHEKYDGSGYRTLDHDRIPLEARILAVADAFDSLTSDRPYRRAITPFEAKNIIIESSGKDFDPVVVDAFLTTFSRGEMELPEFLV